VLNGLIFLGLMLITEHSRSLDLRRSSKLLELLAILHVLSALFANALNHRNDVAVRVDVWLYLIAALAFAILAPFRSRWRLLVGGLAGCGLGSYLLVDLGLVLASRSSLALASAGLLVAVAHSVTCGGDRADRVRLAASRDITGPRVSPMPFSSRCRDSQHLGGLLKGQTGEEVQLHQFGLGSILCRETVQRLVKGQHLIVSIAAARSSPSRLTRSRSPPCRRAFLRRAISIRIRRMASAAAGEK